MIRHLELSRPLLLAVLLSGCVNHQSQSPAPIETAKGGAAQSGDESSGAASQSNPASVTPSQSVPAPPQFRSIDWDASVRPLLAKMQQTSGIAPGSILMVDRVKNSTNGSVQTEKADTAISQALAGSQFTLVTQAQLSQTKQALGLSSNDSLNSRSKAIGLARNLNAQYVLYSTARGDIKTAKIQMLLMLVQSGEIIWNGSGEASYTTY